MYKTFPRKGRIYEVARFGDRSTFRYFNNLEDAIAYYDDRCRVRNFWTVELNEYLDGTQVKRIYSTQGRPPGYKGNGVFAMTPFRDIYYARK